MFALRSRARSTYKTLLLILATQAGACTSLQAEPQASRVRAAAVLGLLSEYRKDAVWFRDDHAQGQYTRVKNFSCGSGIATVERNYNTKMSQFFASGASSVFPSMPYAERAKLEGFLPKTWRDLERVAAESRIAGDNGAFLLSLAIRETGANPFLEEGTQSRFYKRPGTGLMQMTAIHKVVDGKPVAWAFDDYVSYKGFYSSVKPGDRRLPAEVSYAGAKQIRTADDLFGSAFNPYASLWYGNEKIEGHKAEQLRAPRFREAGFDFDQTGRLGRANRAAILGTMYNAGCHRMRCAVLRAQAWNEDSRTERMNQHDWNTLRSFIYLDSGKAREAGVPSDLVTKLKNVCVGKTDSCSEVPGETCSCLDTESAGSRPSPLDGYAWRGAIAMSYGDHITKIAACF